MRLDIRIPIGLLFTVFGVLLVVFGAVGNKQIYTRSLGLNINLEWGLVLLVFGIIMFLFGRRAARKTAARPVQAENDYAEAGKRAH